MLRFSETDPVLKCVNHATLNHHLQNAV